MGPPAPVCKIGRGVHKQRHIACGDQQQVRVATSAGTTFSIADPRPIAFADAMRLAPNHKGVDARRPLREQCAAPCPPEAGLVRVNVRASIVDR